MQVINMKVLIVGCAGQVGSELIKRGPKHWDIQAVNRRQLDITDAGQVDDIVSMFSPNVIINAAAYTAVDLAETNIDQAYAINRDGVANLARAAHACGAKLLHISTDYVFHGDQKEAYFESDETGPAGVYGASKLAGEEAIIQACPQHIILRTAWVFGAYGGNFVKTMIRLAKERTQLNVVGDQLGGPTYAGDIAETLFTIAAKVCDKGFTAWGIYHYTGAPYTNWAEFAAFITEKAHEKGLTAHRPNINPITSSEYPTPAKRPANSMLACDKIYSTFGIVPSDWQSALDHITLYVEN
jgi:dTDP-4-dehydrorhamnose reductase